MILEITPAFAKGKGFKSNVFTDVTVHRETAKAILVSAKGLVSQSDNCWFCNKPLMSLDSMLVGIGPVCAKELGVPYPMTAAEAEEWMSESAVLSEEWIPKSVVRRPAELTTQPDTASTAVVFKSWRTDVECAGTLSIGYRPTDLHNRYKDCICLEIFCEMNSEFNNQILSIEGAKWRGESRSTPSWRNDRKFGKDKIFTVPFSTDAATVIYNICVQWKVDLTIDNDLIELVKSRIKSAKDRQQVADDLGIETIQNIKKLTPTELDEIDFDVIMKTDPWNHQKAAVAFCAAVMGLELPRNTSE